MSFTAHPFRTIIDIQPPGFSIDHRSPILLAGSCFTRYLGEKLKYFKFPVMINPAGIQYNPASIASVLRRIIENSPFTPEELEHDRGVWFSWLHHGDFSDTDQKRCLDNINYKLAEAHDFLLQARCLCLTFGTARYYMHAEKNIIVSNCHKQPARTFIHSFLQPADIVSHIIPVLELIRSVNRNISFLFTVSPVRHLQDGAVDNQRSKASLILAIQRILDFPGTGYFPSYEIVLDELRDYRFYEDDMVHPSRAAVHYIWERFVHTLCSEETVKLCSRIESLRKAAEHRPRHPGSTEDKNFVQKTLREIEMFEMEVPEIDLTEQKMILETR